MSLSEPDRRIWMDTDRPGETITIARPVAGVEVVSVRGSHRHWRESHESFTLALIHGSQSRLVAEWSARGQSLTSEGGDIMALEPGDIHNTQRLRLEAGTADFDIVRFSEPLVAEAARHLGARRAFHFRTPAVRDQPTYHALRQIVAAVAAGSDAIDVDCASALNALVSRQAAGPECRAQGRDPVRDYRLRRVKDYLHAHLDRRPTLSELEAVADLSQYRLCVIFKAAYDVTIGEYWNALRLAEAVRRLQRGVPLKLIVGELGYVDEPYFWRVFKAHYGVAPGAWLSLYRANDRLASVLAPHLASSEIRVPNRRAPGSNASSV